MKNLSLIGWAAATALAAGAMVAPAHAQLEQAISVSQETATEGAASQGRIDQLDDQITGIERDYRATLKQLERLQRYNGTLRRQIRSQELEIEQLQADIDNVANLQRDVVPLMEDMLDALDNFVEADVPFLLEERRGRIASLRATMGNAAASPADKYRAIMQAYEIESEYGRTIEAPEGFFTDSNGQERQVDFLRIGRVALVYRTFDQSEFGVWNQATRSWDTLPGSYRDDVDRGIDMARELRPPDLLTIPVPAPQAAQ